VEEAFPIMDLSAKMAEAGSGMTAEGLGEPALSRTKDTVEVIGKIFLGMVAILYVTGFTVVTVYLNKFGVCSVEFFKK
jgi:hypothetical protein